jgi:hypothetical protein
LIYQPPPDSIDRSAKRPALNGKWTVAAQATRSRLMILRLTEAHRIYFWSCLYLKTRLFAAKRGAPRLEQTRMSRLQAIENKKFFIVNQLPIK